MKTEGEKIEGNKLIASFVGLTIERKQCNFFLDPPEYELEFSFPDFIPECEQQELYEHEGNRDSYFGIMKFHTSWDWLMPVWVKLRSSVWQSNNGGYPPEFIAISEKFKRECFNATIEAVHDVIVEGIKWYNAQQPLTPSEQDLLIQQQLS